MTDEPLSQTAGAWWRDFRWALVMFFQIVACFLGLLVLTYCVVSWPFVDDGDNKIDTAQITTGQLVSALKNYHNRYRIYPETLDELVTPTGNRNPLIDGGPGALMDPWGNRYQYTLTPGDGVRPDHIVVWTISRQGERIQSEWPRPERGR